MKMIQMKNKIRLIKNNNFLAAELKNQIRHVSITITNFCNNKCEYCTRPLFNEKEFDINKFETLIKWLAKSGINKVIIFGGEPTSHSRLNELLNILKENKITCTLLSNGRFGKTDFFRYIGNVIKQISLHIPTLKDKNRDIWGKESTENIIKLQEYMKKNNVSIPIGLGNVVDHSDWDWRLLLKISNKYNIDFIGFCMAHPTDIFRKNSYAPFMIRESIMPKVFDAFIVFKKYSKKIALDFFMPCLIEDNIKEYHLKKQEIIRRIFQRSYSPQRMYELNFMTDGSVEIGTCLFKENRLVIPNVLNFESLEKLEEHIEKKFKEAVKKKKWPKKCLNCKYFNKVCKGDHLNLISEYEENGD